jgi:hypothetical protein
MSTFRFKLAGLALITALGASAAHAQSYPSLFSGHSRQAAMKPAVEIKQEGRNNGAAAAQNGIDNAIRILQNGSFNTGQVRQDGVNNDATIRQIGKNNNGTITQTGSNNSACLVQIGRNNSGEIVQSGGQSVGVVQTRKGTFEFPAALCELDPKNPGKLRRAVRGYF